MSRIKKLLECFLNMMFQLAKKLWIPKRILRFLFHNIFSLTVTGLSGLSMPEDYGSKSSGTVSHQSLPAFSQTPFGARSSFRGYSPPYSSSQQNTTGNAAVSAVEATSWTYASPTTDALTTQYGTPSRRQTVNPATAPTQISAAASLTASKYFFINQTT